MSENDGSKTAIQGNWTQAPFCLEHSLSYLYGLSSPRSLCPREFWEADLTGDKRLSHWLPLPSFHSHCLAFLCEDVFLKWALPGREMIFGQLFPASPPLLLTQRSSREFLNGMLNISFNPMSLGLLNYTHENLLTVFSKMLSQSCIKVPTDRQWEH